MRRTWVVAKNEFLKRVVTRWFVVTTLLGPIALIAIFAVIGIMTAQSMESGTKTIAVLDGTGRLAAALAAESDEQSVFIPVTVPEDSARQAVLDGRYTGYLIIPDSALSGLGQASYYSMEGGLGSMLNRRLENTIDRVIERHRLAEAQVSPEVLEILASGLDFRSVKLTAEGKDAGDAGMYAAVGFVMGFLIYMAMLIYGSVVMQGVIEEKLSRVVEVIVSSVRPFELLLGKVLGIGAMGLVQMVVWAGLIMGGTLGSGFLISLFVSPTDLGLTASASDEEMLAAMNFTVPTIGVEVFVWFVLFFLVGYLLYASLFSAIGSAVEQQQDAQGLMLPIMLPIIVSIMFMQGVVENPGSTLAVVLSFIPFTSPISMVVRVAVSEVPLWEVLLSFVLLVGAFLGSIWISARIYRIGILMYGKKANLKDLARWIRYA
jgi:ABC-2 type transport system permease protein